ncbi:Low specificity L-threonine aldolase [Aquicella siphonis]|uniref:Low specificity L-threonine aldolase n=1 Tax=Aquicella siphonis TaxID=254247 RepID=A0A5E4PIV5_9COXI|nr:low specificity L-threonine aldolase [Aquicella siphonis]VVC76999.1 Low specificity L-threonine aldolase [Aquicella siphonis]
MKKISFASDNYAGIHPDILRAISDANRHHAPAYGSDEYTASAIETFREHFGADVEVHFVFNGTGANVTALAAMNASYQAVICSDKAHIQVDECGAPEKFTGSKLLLVPTSNGKITVDGIRRQWRRLGDQHYVQSHIISISQTTELGTVYTPDEIRDIADFAHSHQMYLHMDGARLSNAAVFLGLDLKSITRDAGVDVLSFGGTKNGMMIGEAVVLFNRAINGNFMYIRKQSMQLASKMRFISAQFQALLTNQLWQKNAAHANDMALLLAEKLSEFSDIKVTQSVQGNAIFAIMPEVLITELQKKYHFYVWDEDRYEVRLMTSFDTEAADIEAFVRDIRELRTA